MRRKRGVTKNPRPKDHDMLPGWALDRAVERARVKRALLACLMRLGLTATEAREAMGLSRQRIHQILRKAHAESCRIGGWSFEWARRERGEELDGLGVE